MDKKMLVILVAGLLIGAVAVYGVAQWVFYSPTVTYEEIEARVELSLDGETWGAQNVTIFAEMPLYSRVRVDAGNYLGNVSITWTLEKFVDSQWVDQNLTKETFGWLTLSPIVYCSPTGVSSPLYDWGAIIGATERGDTFRLTVEILPFNGGMNEWKENH